MWTAIFVIAFLTDISVRVILYFMRKRENIKMFEAAEINKMLADLKPGDQFPLELLGMTKSDWKRACKQASKDAHVEGEE